MNEPSSSRRLKAVVTPEAVRFTRELAVNGNFDQALALAREKLQYGLPTVEVLAALYLPVLREIGELWHSGTITHEDQAVASRVCDHVLDHVWPSSFDGAHRGAVIVAAPMGETHTFAARLTALGLSADGWLVLDLGAEVEPADLGAALASIPDVHGVVVHSAATSCLPSALDLIEVAHGRGVGVVIGGRGFGEEGCYGARLGASAWVAQPGCVVAERLPAPVIAHPGPSEPARLACAEVLRRRAEMASAGRCRFADVLPADATGALAPGPFLGADLAAAVLVGSPELMAESVGWYAAFVAARGASTAPLAAVLDSLSAAMADVHACDAPLAAARLALA